jgi:quercetin dioxygenase-like cupin family protein
MSRAVLGLVALLAMPVPALAQDPVQVDPSHYSVVIENDQVRVLRAALGPGEKTPPHEHPATVVIPLTGGVGRFTLADGRTQELTMVAGTPLWIGAEKHAVENIGTTRVEVIVVELKPRE